MSSTLAVAWRTVLKRLAADWLILTAAVATVVLATVLLASGPIYADAVTLSALQRSLLDAPAGDAYLNIGQRLPADLYDTADRLVVEAVAETFSPTGVDVLRHTKSESFDLPISTSNGTVELAVFEHFEAIADHANLTDGRWPQTAANSAETSILEATSLLLDLTVGDELVLTNRRDMTFQATIRIVGIYQIADPTDPFWFEDPLALRGTAGQAGFTTYGPFVVDQQTMVNRLTRDRLETDWRVFPKYENLATADLLPVRRQVLNLEDRLRSVFVEIAGGEPLQISEFSLTTELPRLLTQAERSVTVTRSTVIAILVQLAILAGYALALTAGLLVGARRTETNLLRSRGASPNQILTIAVMEGVLLTAPAAFAAPWLASQALDLFNNIGPLSSIGLSIETRPTSEAYFLAVLAAAGAVFALSWPAYRSAKKFPDSGQERRQQTRSATQQAGFDLGLLALATVVFWQLQSLGPQISATIRGRFGVDPLLILAPALGLLAGAVLALRMIPLLARVAERIASRSRWTVSALSAWQVARRPLRYARSALLLIMAIGIGFFAASFSTTWVQSQKDQAEFDTGGDIKVMPNRRLNNSIPDLYLATAHERADGVISSMPMLRKTEQLTRAGGREQFMLFDAQRSAGVVTIRDDLSPDFDQLMTEMAGRRPTLATIPLPEEPTKIGLVMAVSEDWSFPERFLGPNPQTGFDFRVSAVLQDGDGLLHKVRLGSIPVNIGRVRLEADLTFPLADGTVATPRFPVSLIDVEILSPVPIHINHDTVVILGSIFVQQSDTRWERVPAEMGSQGWEVDRSSLSGLFTQPRIEFTDSQSPNTLSLDISTGATDLGFSPPQYFSIRPGGTMLPELMPIVVSESFLDSNGTTVGELVKLSSLGLDNIDAQILGTIVEFPTINDDSVETILVDLPTVQMMSYRSGVSIERASEYWLATSGDNDSELEQQLFGPQFESVQVEGAKSRTQSLVTDPIALGTIGALSLGFVAAAAFATVGFAVSATVSARERIKEFALLRALGLSPKQLASWITLEQGVLVVLSLALGTLVGVVLTALVLPLVSLTQGGANAVPEVIIIFPWQTVLNLELAVLAVLGIMVIAMTILLRRLGLGSMLRLGDD